MRDWSFLGEKWTKWFVFVGFLLICIIVWRSVLHKLVG